MADLARPEAGASVLRLFTKKIGHASSNGLTVNGFPGAGSIIYASSQRSTVLNFLPVCVPGMQQETQNAIRYCAVGDVLVEFCPESAKAGAKFAVEAKEDATALPTPLLPFASSESQVTFLDNIAQLRMLVPTV